MFSNKCIVRLYEKGENNHIFHNIYNKITNNNNNNNLYNNNANVCLCVCLSVCLGRKHFVGSFRKKRVGYDSAFSSEVSRVG